MALRNRISESSVSVGTSLTTLATIDVSGIDYLTATIQSTAGSTLNAFEIQAQSNGSAYKTLFSSSSDYTNPLGDLIMTTDDLTTIANGDEEMFKMDVRGYTNIRLQASVASSTATIDVEGEVS